MLKNIIERRCVNISALSRAIGISRSTIKRHMEGHRMSLEAAKKYADFFGVGMSLFVREEEDDSSR